ncbi:stage II sporulation protein R [Natranaerobius thermophilus]|nr:stage II sporulation protein R [Natranaerobius thermophilus]
MNKFINKFRELTDRTKLLIITHKITKRTFLIIFMCVLGVFFATHSLFLGVEELTNSIGHRHESQNQVDEDILRLHIIPNSDLEQDQDAKEKVRNWLIGELMKNREIKNRRAFTNYIETHKDELEEEMENHLVNNGYYHDVNLSLKEKVFPTRRYRTEVLPGGEYESLVVTLDKGQGSNWWCVLFPPLCYVDLAVMNDEKLEDPEEDQETKGDSDELELKFVLFEWVSELLS